MSKLSKAWKIFAENGLRSLINALSRKLVARMMLQKVPIHPSYAQIEITNLCNLRCGMCPLSDKTYVPLGGNHNMKLAEFQHIIDRLPPVHYITLHGVGEPTVNPDLIGMIQYATSKGIRVGLVSNGMLLKPVKARELILSGLSQLGISLDGANPETFERIRQYASFALLAENVQGMVKMKSELAKDTPHLRIMVVGMKENLHEIPQIIQLANSWGIEHVSVKNLHVAENGSTDVLTDDDIQYLATHCAQVARQLGIHFSYPRFTALDNHKLKMTCRWPWNSTYVTANGSVTPCCNAIDKSSVLGNMFETPFEEIWNNQAYQDFRFQMRTNMPDVCERCPTYGMSVVEVVPQRSESAPVS